MELLEMEGEKKLRVFKEQQGNSIILYESQITELRQKIEEMERIFRALLREGDKFQTEVWDISNN